MSGRFEQDNKREIWISNKLDNSPSILVNYMSSIKKKTSSTRKAYLGYLVDFFAFLDNNSISYENVKPMHIDMYIDYLQNKGNKESIINAKLSAVISFYDFLIDNEIVGKNPCSTKKKFAIKKKDKVVYMTDDEVKKLKDNVIKNKIKFCNRDLCIIKIGCSTGLRVSAIVNIDIEDIDFEEKTISVIEKGDKKRIIFIGENTINDIQRWMKDRKKITEDNKGALFISQKTHERLDVSTVQRMIKKYSIGIGKHITPHKMRSTCAMNLYDKTGDIYLTAQQLGHENIKNTMIYARATDEKRKIAAELLD